MRHLTMATVVVLATAVSAQAQQETFTGFVGFGDSLSDGGRFGTLQPPSNQGRFSDGDVWMELLREEFEGLNLAAFNMALGGATAGPDNTNDPAYATVDAITPRDPGNPNDIPLLDLRNFQAQVTSFVDAGFSTQVGTNPLTAVLIGANDFLQGGALTNPFEVVSNIVAGIEAVANIGPQFDSFMVATLPDVSAGPTGVGLTDFERIAIAAATEGFNALLTLQLEALAASDGLEIEFFDFYGTFNDVVEEAELAGLTIDEACTGSVNSVVFDPNNQCLVPGSSSEFLFIDSVHPGDFAHDRLGAAAIEQIAGRLPSQPAPVPLPATAPLALIGLLGLGLVARRRAA